MEDCAAPMDTAGYVVVLEVAVAAPSSADPAGVAVVGALLALLARAGLPDEAPIALVAADRVAFHIPVSAEAPDLALGVAVARWRGASGDLRRGEWTLLRTEVRRAPPGRPLMWGPV
jgi:hypothetical protein